MKAHIPMSCKQKNALRKEAQIVIQEEMEKQRNDFTRKVFKLNKHGDSLFQSEELNEEYVDYGAIILEKSGLVCAIEWQKDRIIEIYTDLLQETSSNEFDKRSQFDRMKSHIDDHLRWWKPEYGDYTAYNIDENCEGIVKSWLYEHTIFDLVRIYKSFDWENKCLMFAGW